MHEAVDIDLTQRVVAFLNRINVRLVSQLLSLHYLHHCVLDNLHTDLVHFLTPHRVLDV